MLRSRNIDAGDLMFFIVSVCGVIKDSHATLAHDATGRT